MEVISTDRAPAALGPYSQAIRVNGMIYCSGQIPINPATGAIEAVSIEDQTAQAISNLRNVLEKAGSALSKVVKTTVFIKDMNDFAALNKVYAEMFCRIEYFINGFFRIITRNTESISPGICTCDVGLNAIVKIIACLLIFWKNTNSKAKLFLTELFNFNGKNTIFL